MTVIDVTRFKDETFLRFQKQIQRLRIDDDMKRKKEFIIFDISFSIDNKFYRRGISILNLL